jgi:succinoglycan biosynthesis protein ExoA
VPALPLLAVIPCLNEAAHIEGLVGALLAEADADPSGPALRIAVVDGGSSDGTQAIVARLAADERVVLMANPDRIQSSAINRAVAAHGDEVDYFVRIDAHARYPNGFCATLLAQARSTEADSVVVAMRTAGTGMFQLAAAAAQNSPLGNGGSAHRNAHQDPDAEPGRWVDHGHHALIRVAAFRAVGGYDESFTHNEDAELDVRLKAAGYRIWLTTRTWCEYYPRATPGALLRQYLNYGNGRARNVIKHGSLPRARQLVMLMVAPAVLLAGLTKVSRLAAVPALTWAAACLGYGVVLGVRQRRPSIALAGPAAMIMHLGWSAGFWRTVIKSVAAPRPARPRPSGSPGVEPAVR